MVIKESKFTRGLAKPIKLNLDLLTYDILCRYILQNNAFVKMEHLYNLRKLMSIIDYSTYENDPEKVKRTNFIIKGLEARLDNNINDRDLVLTYINGGLTFKVDFLDYSRIDLTKDEIYFVHNLVIETLQYQFIYNKIDDMMDICTRFKSSNYSTRGGIIKEMEKMVDELKTEFRRSKISDNAIDMVFSLVAGKFESVIKDTYNMITNPSRRLICGMQGINELTGGGFESGRVYMFLGSSGIGKSITLLNLAYQFKKYNYNYKTKDPTKIPAIVILTMENTVVETITRLFDLVIENSHGMENYPIDEVIRMLREEGQLVLNESSPIDIIIKYKANKSVDTSYLYTLYDDLQDQGYEMICLIQDHVKRIRSVYYGSELRIELGDIVNEFKTFAAEKDIPVLTNSHLNREATKIIEDATRKGNQDIGKLIGKSSTGESMLMIDNLDVGFTITLDYDRDGNRYMAFNAVKMRGKSGRDYIAQPFVRGSTIRLLEDFGGIPQFKESIHVAPEVNKKTIIKVSGASTMSDNINEVLNIDEDDLEDNAFAKKSYTLDPNVPKRQVICPIEFVGMSQNSMQIANLRNQFLTHQAQVQQQRQVICPIEFI